MSSLGRPQPTGGSCRRSHPLLASCSQGPDVEDIVSSPREHEPQGQGRSALPASSSCLHPQPTAAWRAPRAQGEASGG